MTEVFDYEASIWGAGEASVAWSHPTSFRLRRCLELVKNLPPGARVLEIGTGGGQFIRAVKKEFPRLECLGSDISEEAIRLARELHDGVKYDLSTEDKQPYADASIDAVVILDVVEHVTNPEELLKEVYRVLKPGGLFYCFVPCEGDSLSLWNFLDRLGLKKNLTRRFAGHINYFSRLQLAALFKQVGFTAERTQYSEHVLGQLLGVLAFSLMAWSARHSPSGQLNNEAYFTKSSSNHLMAILISGGKKLVNTLVYLESMFLTRLPSPNVHSFLRKP